MAIKYYCDWCSKPTDSVTYIKRGADIFLVCNDCVHHVSMPEHLKFLDRLKNLPIDLYKDVKKFLDKD